ncbi:hypothetical protein ACXZ1K_16005 [Pedobacter sp. PWIIR3]
MGSSQPAPESSTNKSLWKSFTTKDVAALTVSFLALMLSVCNFYYNAVRVSDSLQGRIMDCDIIAANNPSGSDSLLITIAYINSGNRQAISLVPSYQCVNNIKDENKTWGGLFKIKDPFPLVLEPLQMKLIRLTLSLNDIQKNVADNIKQNDSLVASFIRLKFFALDSHARLRTGKTGFQIKVITNANKILSAIPANGHKIYPESPSVVIF